MLVLAFNHVLELGHVPAGNPVSLNTFSRVVALQAEAKRAAEIKTEMQAGQLELEVS